MTEVTWHIHTHIVYTVVYVDLVANESKYKTSLFLMLKVWHVLTQNEASL